MKTRVPFQTPQVIGDAQLEHVRRQQSEALEKLSKLPATSLSIVANVQLADGVETPVAHKLGRPPAFVRESCPRGATASGRVVEVRSATHDRSKVVVLKAIGFAATITVDLVVM